MILRIDTGHNTASVAEADDCKRLSAEIVGGGDINTTLGPLGVADADGAHLWIAVDELRKAAMPAHDADWVGRFDGMVKYAQSKGWMDASHTRVRVHITRA